jgi:hypothetical protein
LQLRLFEARTSDAPLYARLAVELFHSAA